MASEIARAVYLAPITGVTGNTDILNNRFHFPVTGPEITKSGTGQWTTNNLLGVGEVAHPLGPSLATYTMSSFFPAYYSESLCKGLRSPSQFLNPKTACRYLEKLRDDNDLMWLVIGSELGTSGLNIVNLGNAASNVVMDPVRITDFSWSEVAGRIDQRIFDITFAQWTQPSGAIIVPFAIPKTYDPQPNEDLRDVAVRWYRDINQWKRIALANNLIEINKKAKVAPYIIPKVKNKEKKLVPKRLKLPNP